MVGFVTRTYRQEALVEAFVPGAEVTVGVLGNDPPRIAGMMEIVPKTVSPAEFVYSLEVKRDWENRVAYRVPPALPGPVLSEIERARWDLPGPRVPRLLADRFPSRRGGAPHFIECNPLRAFLRDTATFRSWRSGWGSLICPSSRRSSPTPCAASDEGRVSPVATDGSRVAVLYTSVFEALKDVKEELREDMDLAITARSVTEALRSAGHDAWTQTFGKDRRS